MSAGLYVLQTSPSLAEATGGPARTIVALSEALAQRGVAVDVITRDNSPMLPDPARVGARLVTGSSGFGAAIRAGHAAHPGVTTIVHDNGIWTPSNYLSVRAAQRLGLTYVITPHGMLKPWAMAFHRIRKQVAWRVYQQQALAKAGALVATAEDERAAIRQLFPQSPIAVIPNGVTVPPLRPVRLRPECAPATLLTMSRINPSKNLLGLLDAWAVLCADPALAHWTLQIAGPDQGGHTEVVRARAVELGIAARVLILGSIAEADKTAVFAAADLFVLPSFSENFGIVVTEALAHAVPVVATTGAPWAELPRRGCGWWTTPDPHGLTAALHEAMRLSATDRAAMGLRGRTWVAEAFDWGSIAEQTLALYEWLIGGGHRPDFVDT